MDDKSKEVLKTGTTTVGIVCKDGIILAADRRSTAGYIAHKKFHKVIQIADNMAVTVAGTVSEVQLLAKLIKAELKLKDLQTGRISNSKEAANLLSGMIYSNFRRMAFFPAITGFLLGGFDQDGGHLYELGVDGSVMDVEEYTSDGSGSLFALGVLESTYKKGLTIEEGVKLVVKAINTAIQRDPNSGNGIDVITITEKGVETVFEKELIAKIEV